MGVWKGHQAYPGEYAWFLLFLCFLLVTVKDRGLGWSESVVPLLHSNDFMHFVLQRTKFLPSWLLFIPEYSALLFYKFCHSRTVKILD